MNTLREGEITSCRRPRAPVQSLSTPLAALGFAFSAFWSLPVLGSTWIGFTAPDLFEAERVPVWARVFESLVFGKAWWMLPTAMTFAASAFIGSLAASRREHSDLSGNPVLLGLSLNVVVLLAWGAMALIAPR